MRLLGAPGQTGIDNRTNRLRATARQLGPSIRRGLKKLGQAAWSQPGRGRWLPGRLFRIREERQADRYVWWIERDIPPADLYRCAAYQVVLTQGERGEMNLTVRTGLGDYPVPRPEIVSLDNVLDEAARDPALVIPRKMGVVYD
jgi:hypothetical protein